MGATDSAAQFSDDESLTAAETQRLLKVKSRAWADFKKRPDFPKARALAGTRLNPRSLRWLRSEVLAWIKAQPAIDVGSEPVELARARAARDRELPENEKSALPSTEATDSELRFSAAAAAKSLSRSTT